MGLLGSMADLPEMSIGKGRAADAPPSSRLHRFDLGQCMWPTLPAMVPNTDGEAQQPLQ